jgi:hypothetical protein
MLEKTDKHKLGEKASLHEVHELFTKEFKFTPRSFKAFLMKYPEIFRYSMEEIKEFLSYAQGVLELTPVNKISLNSLTSFCYRKK